MSEQMSLIDVYQIQIFFSLLLWTFETLSEALSSIVYLAQLKSNLPC